MPDPFISWVTSLHNIAVTIQAPFTCQASLFYPCSPQPSLSLVRHTNRRPGPASHSLIPPHQSSLEPHHTPLPLHPAPLHSTFHSSTTLFCLLYLVPVFPVTNPPHPNFLHLPSFPIPLFFFLVLRGDWFLFSLEFFWWGK